MENKNRLPIVFNLVVQNEKAGAQNIAYAIYKHLSQSGCDSRLVFLYQKSKEGYHGHGIYTVDNSSVLNMHKKLFAVLNAFLLLRKSRAEVLYCHTKFALIAAGLLGKLFGIKRVIWVQHGLLSASSRTFVALQKIIGSTFLVDRIVCVSDTVRTEFNNFPKAYKKKLVTILNTIDFMGCDKADRHQGVEPGQTIRLFTSGRLHRKKNQKVLIDLIYRFEGLSLKIAGDGELREVYSGIISSLNVEGRCQLTGPLSRSQLKEELQKCDVFVFPSLEETFGLSVVEAMFFLKPIVCADIPALREVADGYAEFVEPSCLEQWFDAISRVSNLSAEELEVRRETTKYSQYFNRTMMLKQYAALIDGSPLD